MKLSAKQINNRLQKTVKEISKELFLLSMEKQNRCTTDKEKNKAHEEARQVINATYGKWWREKDIFTTTHDS